MGISFSALIGPKSPHNTELISKNVGSDCDIRGKPESVLVSRTLRSEGEILQSPNLKRFDYTDLKNATRNFRPSAMVGKGGLGLVYKGRLDEQSLTALKPGVGMLVAVKILKLDGWQGHQEWLAEVYYLGRLSHPHIVKLIGYCLEDEHRILVYEFMTRGSLEYHLFGSCLNSPPLSWSLRLKIALAAAKGLAFLHNAEKQVIYRDFKTSNILLDSNYNAKLSDFGLAKDGPTGDKSHAAPEYISSGHLSTMSDVYSFGVVLLEMLSGRRAVDKNRPPRQQHLVQWAKPYLSKKQKILNVLDHRVQGQYLPEKAYKATTLAYRCLSTETKLRPDMKEVVIQLQMLQEKTET